MDHPGRAKGVLADLSPQYMADCAPYLDQRTVAVLLADQVVAAVGAGGPR